MNRTDRSGMVSLWGLRLLAYGVAFAVGAILFDVVAKGVGALSWEFLSTMPRRGATEGGILPAIVGTLLLVAGSMGFALPVGVASAIYLTEYAGQGPFTRLVRVGIVTLAGVPSIVFGLFGLGLFVIFLRMGASVLAGSLTLACLVLPTIIVSSEEALRSVPRSFRDGSLALGAAQWQTIWRNVLPYALPRIFTGAILGVGRVAGEAAPILFTAAAFYLPRLPSSPFDQVMALPYHLFVLATQHPDVGKVRPLQYGTALVLVLLVLGVNAAAIVLRHRLGKKYRW